MRPGCREVARAWCGRGGDQAGYAWVIPPTGPSVAPEGPRRRASALHSFSQTQRVTCSSCKYGCCRGLGRNRPCPGRIGGGGRPTTVRGNRQLRQRDYRQPGRRTAPKAGTCWAARVTSISSIRTQVAVSGANPTTRHRPCTIDRFHRIAVVLAPKQK